MDQDKTCEELLKEVVYCQAPSPLTGESIDMSFSDVIADVSASNATITFVLADSTTSQESILLSSEALDAIKDSDDISDENQKEFDSEADKQVPKDLYTIHYPEKEPVSADCNSEIISKLSKEIANANLLSADDESMKHQSDLHTIETTTRLEDFMDVVTTYKCKFCRFCCPWRSGLMSHIRNCHINGSKKITETEVHNYALAPCGENRSYKKGSKLIELREHGYSQSPHSEEEKDENAEDATKENGNHNPTPPLERHVFLCGQCSEGFEVLEECKNHMIKDHDLKLNSNENTTKAHITAVRKRGNQRNRSSGGRASVASRKELSPPEDAEAKSDAETENGATGSQRRTSRTTKISEDGYLLDNKKKRPRRDNSAEKPFRCNEKGCGYRFTNESQLHYHTNCHASYTDKSFVCLECGQTAENWRSLSMHLWKEHTIDIDLHTCDECGYKTHSLFKLDNHKKIHSEERQFVCSTCNKGFKQLSQLRNHVVIHSDRKNMPEKRWYSEQKCEVCNRTFSDSKCLKKHQQAVHSKLKPFVCTYCGHMSARKAMLQLHMRQHTGEKPFKCEHCEYRTGDHNSLRRHRMRHSGIKPYKCPHCSYACIQAISYKTHLKNKHPGLEGLYICTLCPFRSVSKENHLNHMEDHKRGAISDRNTINSISTELNQPAQMHLPENTLQQLEGILPENITAAQLILSCLNALNQKNGNLPPGVTSSSATDGTQTITIQIPTVQEVSEEEQFFLTVQQSEDGVMLSNTNEEEEEEDISVDTEILQPITVMEEGPFTDSQTELYSLRVGDADQA